MYNLSFVVNIGMSEAMILEKKISGRRPLSQTLFYLLFEETFFFKNNLDFPFNKRKFVPRMGKLIKKNEKFIDRWTEDIRRSVRSLEPFVQMS